MHRMYAVMKFVCLCLANYNRQDVVAIRRAITANTEFIFVCVRSSAVVCIGFPTVCFQYWQPTRPSVMNPISCLAHLLSAAPFAQKVVFTTILHCMRYILPLLSGSCAVIKRDRVAISMHTHIKGST